MGQVYPRSLDFEVVSLFFVGISSGKFAKTRIMAGHELLGEVSPRQTGSSAMPHKMNSRSCERINGFHAILSGYVTMATQLSGDQWNEGDVSCSVVRRLMLQMHFSLSTDSLILLLQYLIKWRFFLRLLVQKEKNTFLTKHDSYDGSRQSGSGQRDRTQRLKSML